MIAERHDEAVAQARQQAQRLQGLSAPVYEVTGAPQMVGTTIAATNTTVTMAKVPR